jgi:hypothetical protein
VSEVKISVDSSDCVAAIDLLIRLQGEEGRKGSKEAAELIGNRTSDVLTMQWHGPGTKTPSVPGTPPAAISGELAASVVVREDGESYLVGPTTDYGREQELGGPMQGHPYMHWFEEGIEHFSAHHDLPERPSLKPSVESAVNSGEVTDIYTDHWARGQREATA